MAASPAHRFGQILGDVLEESVEPLPRSFCDKHGLYLDKKGYRRARGAVKNCRWTDGSGNAHDLDFVIERGGTDSVIGVPAASSTSRPSTRVQRPRRP